MNFEILQPTVAPAAEIEFLFYSQLNSAKQTIESIADIGKHFVETRLNSS